MTDLTFKMLKDLDPDVQVILEPYINPFVYAKTQDQKDEIYDKSSKETLLTKKEIYTILNNERRKIRYNHTAKMGQLSMSDNDAFITKYNIREKIPQNKLPCIFGINMFGEVKYADKMIDIPTSNKDPQFFSKIDKQYVCSGWRC